MTITLITPEQHALLVKLQEEHPILTLENKGYETINQSRFSEADKEAFNQVTEMLNKHIKGFSSFNNFKHRKNGELVLRFQYCWTADEINPSTSFTGVGYLLVDELLNGFRGPHETPSEFILPH